MLCFVLLLVLVQESSFLKNCEPEIRFLHYYKIKSCHKSKMTVIALRDVESLNDCKKQAREKRGFAFNFSPAEAVNLTKIYHHNCEILDCPESENSTTLIVDYAYDYYSAFGNTTIVDKSLCLRTVGLFGLLTEKLNYSQAIWTCQTLGADLANILTESRTNSLSNFIKTSIPDWYKAAYVGLDDISVEGDFKSAFGDYLSCGKYRAWAPGHPRSKLKSQDCVILDSERTWRTVRCKEKLPAICEFFSQPPAFRVDKFQNVTCRKIHEKREKKKCLKEKRMFEIYSKSSRMDQCALILE